MKEKESDSAADSTTTMDNEGKPVTDLNVTDSTMVECEGSKDKVPRTRDEVSSTEDIVPLKKPRLYVANQVAVSPATIFAGLRRTVGVGTSSQPKPISSVFDERGLQLLAKSCRPYPILPPSQRH